MRRLDDPMHARTDVDSSSPIYRAISIFSYPQRVPTFMGGSYDRGWGPLAGTVDIQVTEASGDRINAIKLTLTATQITTIPKTASTDAPSALDRMGIDPDETKTKETTLLQLEQVLSSPPRLIQTPISCRKGGIHTRSASNYLFSAKRTRRTLRCCHPPASSSHYYSVQTMSRRIRAHRAFRQVESQRQRSASTSLGHGQIPAQADRPEIWPA